MATITFAARGVRNVFQDTVRLRQWLIDVARDHAVAINEITFVIMDDEALLTFNKRYLGHDNYTDVITFAGEPGVGLSGDVLMSYPRIRENAQTFHVSVQLELRRVMVHGILHLLGHVDKTERKRAAMRAQEDKYLSRF